MQKTKILAVAPYEGMADILTDIAQSRDDIALTVQTGDLFTGRDIAMQLAHKNYDVIISRGGTAELIQSAVELPVIDISISVYDILLSIKLAESYNGKFVIAGFPGITANAHLLCDLLQYDIDIITFKDSADAVNHLKKAKENGCTLVLCDVTGARAAKDIGLNYNLVTSGRESIENAVAEAVKLVHSSNYVHKQKDLFQSLLTEDDREFLIYSPAGTLWFSSIAIDEMNTSLMNFVQTYIKSFLKVPNQTVSHQIRDNVYTLYNRHLIYEDQKYTAITICKSPALTAEDDPGFQIYNIDNTSSNDFADAYNGTGKAGKIAQIVEEYAKSHLPVLILGENGTGKGKAASLIYKQSNYKHAPFYSIDCSLIKERKWHSLLNNENSPLNEVDSTVFFEKADALSLEQIGDLFQYIDQTKLCTRMRLIVSLSTNNSNQPAFATIRTFMENHLSCLTLNLPPLRERIDDFSGITALYLHRFNVSLGKQIIGFDVEAMEKMLSYNWPNNLDPLQHVLKELVTITKTPYISCDTVEAILKQEPDYGRVFDDSVKFDGTLDEINYQIILQVLHEEHDNKEKTARRLGISRSTLWRILKNNN